MSTRMIRRTPFFPDQVERLDAPQLSSQKDSGASAMNPIRTVHIRIEGRVQGVGYRAWLETTALELQLCGWVRNRHDRSVEAVLQGSAEKVADMLHRCEQGPAAAQVTRVEVIGEGVGVYNGFEVRATV
jgi:acylphosphatase